MSCRCLKGKKLRKIKRGTVKELILFIKKHPQIFRLIAELVNFFRPTDPERVIAERIFLTAKEISDLEILDYKDLCRLLKILKEFFLHSTDKRRGDFLEALISKFGPLTYSERYRRVNQCKVYKKTKMISKKEIDVAFSSRNYLELHECKSNMGRQWRDPLYPKTKKGSKLHFLNSLETVCRNGKKVIPVCSGLDGEISVKAVKQTLRRYGYRKIKVIGRNDIERALLIKLKNVDHPLKS